jgi:hypothetical protein
VDHIDGPPRFVLLARFLGGRAICASGGGEQFPSHPLVLIEFGQTPQTQKDKFSTETWCGVKFRRRKKTMRPTGLPQKFQFNPFKKGTSSLITLHRPDQKYLFPLTRSLGPTVSWGRDTTFPISFDFSPPPLCHDEPSSLGWGCFGNNPPKGPRVKQVKQPPRNAGRITRHQRRRGSACARAQDKFPIAL